MEVEVFDTRKKLTKDKKELNSRLITIRLRLIRAAEVEHENATYQRGWIDCLKYINEVARENKPLTRNPSRQSSIAHRE